MSTGSAMLEYFKEIKEVSLKNFEVPVAAKDNFHDRETYRTGDGDYIQPLRPGSQDHKKCPSRGLLASTRS